MGLRARAGIDRGRECPGPVVRRAATTMVRASLWVVLLLAGCRDAEPASAKGPVTEEPKPLPQVAAQDGPPTRAAEPEPRVEPDRPRRPEPKAPPMGAPAYRRSGSEADGIDDFLFWGWSGDGRRFGFETYFAGSAMADCEGEAELTIVDAGTDRYVDDGHVVVRHRDPEAEVCDPPDLREELGFRRDPRLRREGISPALGTGPIPIEGSGESWSFALPSGERVTLTFRVLHGTDDPMEAADGAGYELRMTVPGQDEVVVENGVRRRPWFMGYDLGRGMVFLGPDGRHAAIMVAQMQVIPEGVRTTWMANGVRLR